MDGRTLRQIRRDDPNWQGSLAPKKTAFQLQMESWEEKVRDIRLCLAGDPRSKTWQNLKTEADNLQASITARRRIAEKQGTTKTE